MSARARCRDSSNISAGLYTCSIAGRVFYKLGKIAEVQVRKARWMWESVAGSEAEAIQAEHAVGLDMAAVVLEETPRDSDHATQALLDDIGGRLAGVVRNRLHRFQMTAIEVDRPTAFALAGGFIFVARSLVHVCHRNNDDIAFVLGMEGGMPEQFEQLDELLLTLGASVGPS